VDLTLEPLFLLLEMPDACCHINVV
jgi:hypothetical protein